MPPIISLLPYILILFVMASVTGAFFYAVARFLESKWRLFPLVLGIPLLLFFLYALLASPAAGFSNVVYLASFLGLATLGGWFHRRRAGGASSDWSRAMFLMLVVDSAAQIVGAILTTALITRSIPMLRGTPVSFDKLSVDMGTLVIYVIIGSFGVYPTLVPLAVWVWRSMKVRPGIDVAASGL